MDTSTRESTWLESQTLLPVGLDRIGIGVFRLDDTGNLVDCNETAAGVLGVDRILRGLPHVSLLDQALGLDLSHRLESLLRSREPFVQKHLRGTDAQGRSLDVDLCCASVPSPDGQSRHLLGILCDSNIRPVGNVSSENLRQELQILTDVAAALSSSRELAQTLLVILTGATASQGLGFNRAFLFLYDEDSDQLMGHMAVGPSSAEEAGHIWSNLDAAHLSLEQLLLNHREGPDAHADPVTGLISGVKVSLANDSLLSRACRAGHWLNLEKVDAIDDVTAGFADRLGTRKMAIVPMVSKGSLQGLIAADNRFTGRPISDDDVYLLQTLANQAAVAMERAKLYDAQKARTDELERMNRLLAESQDQIVQIEKMSVIGQLTSAVAHELRNPLTIIGGFANLMLKSSLPDDRREYLNIIASEVARAEAVLDQVLDFSRASKSDSRDHDLSDLVESSFNLMKGRLRRPDLMVHFSRDPKRLMIHGNGDQLAHAFYQFFRFLAEEMTPPCRAEVRTEARGDSAAMSIAFICPDANRPQTSRLLEQFFADNRTSHRLTIMVAGETIRFHGGSYGVATDKQRPPMLYVELPRKEEAHA